MTEDENQQLHEFKERQVHITWKDLATLALGIISALSVYLWNKESYINSTRHASLQTEVQMIREQLLPQKLDKEVYYQDMRDIKSTLNTMLNMHLQAGYKMPKAGSNE